MPVLGRRAPVVCAFDNETPEEFALVRAGRRRCTEVGLRF